jgi:2'-5' RNA ligase
MNAVRAFIAIDLSTEIYQKLEKVLQDLKGSMGKAPVRWVPATNIHLTIKFLGDVSMGNLDMLKEIIQTEAKRHLSFELSVGEVGTFPSNRRPRVIWVGVEAPPELEALHRGIETETARLGYAPEDRPFSPHLTLGRVSRNVNPGELRQISETLESYKVGFLGAMRVSAVHLYRSDLQPGGSIYTRLISSSLVDVDPQEKLK